jgi:hypothetical protein
MAVKEWTKREVCEGGVAGGEKVHGYTPDGSLLCGATGDGGSDPYPYDKGCNRGDADDFDPTAANSCRKCSASYRKLPD